VPYTSAAHGSRYAACDIEASKNVGATPRRSALPAGQQNRRGRVQLYRFIADSASIRQIVAVEAADRAPISK
jgi:hypothetical protein